MSDVVRIGGRFASLTEAEGWISEYFNPENRVCANPYAHPAYDDYDSGSDPSELNDGDLLAPALLNAAPTVRAFYSLQRVRPELNSALARIPTDLTLADAVRAGSMPVLLGDLVAVLDRPDRPVGASLTTLLKVLHRKRPTFIPLYDQFVGACYRGSGPAFPVRPARQRSWRDYAVAVTEAVSSDLSRQEAVFAHLQQRAPQVATLRLLDVLAWKLGRRSPEHDPSAAPS